MNSAVNAEVIDIINKYESISGLPVAEHTITVLRGGVKSACGSKNHLTTHTRSRKLQQHKFRTLSAVRIS